MLRQRLICHQLLIERMIEVVALRMVVNKSWNQPLTQKMKMLDD